MNQRRALCIGIDAYGGSNQLNGCVNDARAWAKFFKSQKFKVQTLLDAQATFDGILDSIGELIASSSKDDILAIHYSGHGTRVPDTNKEERDGLDEALVPYDFETNGFIVDDLIGPILDRAPAGVTINVFFDCCHSGGGTRLLSMSGPSRSGDEKARFLPLTAKMIATHQQAQHRRTKAAKRDIKRKSRGQLELEVIDGSMREVLFAACQPSEQSLESSGSGHFTRAAMQILGQGITGLSNSSFMELVLREMGDSRRQTPQLSCAPGANSAPFLTLSPDLNHGGTIEVSPIAAGDNPSHVSGTHATPVRSSRRSDVSPPRRSSMSSSRSSSNGSSRNLFRVVKHECRAGRNESADSKRSVGQSGMLGQPFRGLSVPTRASDGGTQARKVFIDGVGRLEVTDPRSQPFARICLLNFLTPNTPSGKIGVGTGWLIAPTVVITAGHCVYDGGWSTDMTVFPGVDDSDSSPVSAKAVRLEAVDGWINSSADNCDFGAIFLDRALDVGHFDFAEFDESDLEQMVVNVAGYPTDKPSQTMWMQAGRMLDADDSFLLYKMDTHGGQSGCPVILWEDGNDFTVVGIHTGHVGTANRAVRIASAVFEQLMTWKNQT